jgi:hypothetical protein
MSKEPKLDINAINMFIASISKQVLAGENLNMLQYVTDRISSTFIKKTNISSV